MGIERKIEFDWGKPDKDLTSSLILRQMDRIAKLVPDQALEQLQRLSKTLERLREVAPQMYEELLVVMRRVEIRLVAGKVMSEDCRWVADCSVDKKVMIMVTRIGAEIALKVSQVTGVGRLLDLP